MLLCLLLTLVLAKWPVDPAFFARESGRVEGTSESLDILKIPALIRKVAGQKNGTEDLMLWLGLLGKE